MINWRDVSVRARDHAKKAGFLAGKPNPHSHISKINGEVAEFEEAHSNGNVADILEYKNRIRLLEAGNGTYGALKEYAFEKIMKDTTGDELADAGIHLANFAEGEGVILQRDHFKNHDEILNIASEEKNVYIMINRLYELISVLGKPLIFVAGYAGVHHHADITNCLYAVEFIAKYLEIDLEYHIEEKMAYNIGRPHLHGKNMK